MIFPCSFHMLFEMSQQRGPCTPFLSTGNISNLFFHPQLLDTQSTFHDRPPSCFTFVVEADLFASDTCCSHGSVSMFVDVSTISPYSYIWCLPFLLPQKANTGIFGFLFCGQLGYFSIHSTKAFRQATAIKLRNSFKGQHLVDLVKTYSFTSLSRTSTSLLVALYCMMISGVLSFFSPLHMSS